MNDNWIMGILAIFVVFAFFGGYYIGASDMEISFNMDDNTMKAITSLNETVNALDTCEKKEPYTNCFWANTESMICIYGTDFNYQIHSTYSNLKKQLENLNSTELEELYNSTGENPYP